MNSEKMTQYSHSKLQHIEFSWAVHDKSIFCWYFLNNYFEQFSLDGLGTKCLINESCLRSIIIFHYNSG